VAKILIHPEALALNQLNFSPHFWSNFNCKFSYEGVTKKLLVAMVIIYKGPTLIWTGWQHPTMQTLLENYTNQKKCNFLKNLKCLNCSQARPINPVS
jgi:hypothetical protein